MEEMTIYLLIAITLAVAAIVMYYSGQAHLKARALKAIAKAEIYSRKATSSLSGEERRVMAVAAYAKLPKSLRLIFSQEMFAMLIDQLFSVLANEVEG